MKGISLALVFGTVLSALSVGAETQPQPKPSHAVQDPAGLSGKQLSCTVSKGALRAPGASPFKAIEVCGTTRYASMVWIELDGQTFMAYADHTRNIKRSLMGDVARVGDDPQKWTTTNQKESEKVPGGYEFRCSIE